MLGLLTAAIPPPWGIVARWAAMALVAVGLAGWGFSKGCAHVRDEWDAANAKADAANLAEVQRLAKVSDRETIRYVTRTQTIHDQVAAVPKVVTAHDDAACVLPADFGRMWNDVNAATADSAAGDLHAAGDTAVEPRTQAR